MNIEEIAVALDSAKNLSVVSLFTDRGVADISVVIDGKNIEFELSEMADIKALHNAENEFKSVHLNIKNYAIDTILRIMKNKVINIPSNKTVKK